MRTFNRIVKGSLSMILIVTLAGCEQKVTVQSVVHEDGSIDRTVVFAAADSSNIRQNIFGVNQAGGWEVTVEPVKKGVDEQKDKQTEKKVSISFGKYFASVEEANQAMNTGADTLFRIQSAFKKQFRWFYTYLRYSDTYISLNRFRDLPQDEFFTAEDYAFIERLPAEGKTISKADSLYLSRLNEKIYDHYASRAIYEENFKLLTDVLLMNNAGPEWIDSLKNKKEDIYRRFVKDDSLNADFLSSVNQILRVPLPINKNDANFLAMTAELEKRINFMSGANEGRYTHVIKMPWDPVSTNADSIHGAEFYWRPPVTKFLLKDYTMYAESRKLNYWTVFASLLVIGTAVFIMFRKRTP